jgi:DNA-binding HxlR family transcriptional regulator
VALDIVGGKWKALLVWHLNHNSVMRFNKLCRVHPKLTPKMLTRQLKELERDGVVTRKSYNQVPPKVEYSLTEYGETLLPALRLLSKWGRNYFTSHETSAQE